MSSPGDGQHPDDRPTEIHRTRPTGPGGPAPAEHRSGGSEDATGPVPRIREGSAPGGSPWAPGAPPPAPTGPPAGGWSGHPQQGWSTPPPGASYPAASYPGAPSSPAGSPGGGQWGPPGGPSGPTGSMPWAAGSAGQGPQQYAGQAPQGYAGQAPQGYAGQAPQGYAGPGPQGYAGSVPPGSVPPPPGWQQAPGSGNGSGSTKRRSPLIWTAVAVVVLLVAGAGVFWLANRDTNQAASGQADPKAAVESLVSSLNSGDVLGATAVLDPAEAAVYTDLTESLFSEFKRLEIIKPDAEVTASGSSIKLDGVTYGPVDEAQPGHLAFVEVTGGTITLTSNPTVAPYTDKVKDALEGTLGDLGASQPMTQTVDIADATAELGQPIRIGVVNRDGGWYPSLFYTLADAWTRATGLPTPAAGDSIPAAGSDSESAAVDGMLSAISKGDLAGVIGLLPPDEMGVLHDYGRLILQESGGDRVTADDLGGFAVSGTEWDVSDATGGGRKVSLLKADITIDGDTASLLRDPADNTLTVSVPGQPTQTLDDATLDTMLRDQLGEDVDPQLVDIAKREVKQLIGTGFVTVEVDGKWYVSPLRTGGELGLSLLQGLQPADIDFFLNQFGR